MDYEQIGAMQMSDQKPREFWIAQGSHADIVCYSEKEAKELEWEKNHIHVIEKSAYDNLLAHCLELEKVADAAMDKYEVRRERDQLRADLDLAIERLKDARGVIYTANQHLLNTYKDDYLSHQNQNNPVNRIDETLAKLQEKRNEF